MQLLLCRTAAISPEDAGKESEGLVSPHLHLLHFRSPPEAMVEPSSEIDSAYAPSRTSVMSSASSPWASRWTASAASLLGALTRQKTRPLPSSNQYLR